MVVPQVSNFGVGRCVVIEIRFPTKIGMVSPARIVGFLIWQVWLFKHPKSNALLFINSSHLSISRAILCEVIHFLADKASNLRFHLGNLLSLVSKASSFLVTRFN